jgi:hypothetical protein
MASILLHDLFKVFMACDVEIDGVRQVGLWVSTSVYPIDGGSCSCPCSKAQESILC